MHPPLFILAPPRSFTSITCAMLGNHPQAFGLAETNLFCADTVRQLERLHDRQSRLRHGLLRSMAHLALGEQTRESVAAVQAWLDRNHERSTADVFALLRLWGEGRAMIEKSPSHVYIEGAMPRMRAACPDACFLHLTRHPLDTWRSIVRTRERVKDAFRRLAQFDDADETGADPGQEGTIGADPDIEGAWLYPHLSIMAFLEQVPKARKLRLRGEDLLADPDTHLAGICRWLGLDGGPEAMEAMKHPEASPFAAYGPSNARFGNDPNFMESPALRPYTPKLMPLDRAMAEAADEGFTGDVRACAAELGY